MTRTDVYHPALGRNVTEVVMTELRNDPLYIEVCDLSLRTY